MSGYTPVFDTVFNGTLCGRWPALPVWLTLLPLADWRGDIDMTYEAIAGRTGWPMDLLKAGIEALTQPDPHSRSKAEQGRRLVPLDDERGWGWRVVNISVYRTKASGKDQVADGRNAEKVKRYRDRHRPTPGDTADTHSDSYTNSDISTSLRSVERKPRPAKYAPEGFQITEDLREWAKAECPAVDIDAETKKFRDHKFREAHTDWVKAWRNWIRRSADFKPRAVGGKTKFELTKEAMRNA